MNGATRIIDDIPTAIDTVPNSWENAARFLMGLRLAGAETDCPKCGCPGLPFTRWTKGPKVKPIHFCHIDLKGSLTTCELDEPSARPVQAEYDLGNDDILGLVRNAKPFVLFSGGKDSLATLAYMKDIAAIAGKTITALHVDTTVGFPEVEVYVRDTCAKLEVQLEVVKPQSDYFSLVADWGIPAFNSRWCCRELKIKPLSTFLQGIDGAKIVFDGIRAAESHVRAKYMPFWFHPGFGCLSVSPIFRWSDEDVQGYIKDQELPQGDHLALGTSGECWCGAYKKRSDFEALCRLNPDLYDKLSEVEANNRNGFTFVYENGERISLQSIRHALEAG